MSEHILTTELERYLLGELKHAEWLAFDSHIGKCGECRSMALSRADLGISAGALEYALSAKLPRHLTYEEIEGIADDILTGNALNRAEKHLGLCGECRDEVAELRDFARPASLVIPDAAQPPVGLTGQFARLFSPRIWALASVGALLVIVFSKWFTLHEKTPADDALSTGTPQIDIITAATPSGPPPEITNAVPPDTETTADVTVSPKLVVSLSDGGTPVGIDDAGNLVGFEGLSQKQNELLRAAFRNGEVTFGTEAKELIPGSGKRMGENSSTVSDSFRLDGPIGKIVDTERPNFSWQPLEGVSSYRVDVFDLNYEKVASSGDLRTTRWTAELPRGRTYIWQVTALKDGKEIRSSQAPATEARFRTLDTARSQSLAAISRRFPRSHLLLGLAYAEAGMISEARRELGSLSRENRNSAILRKLLKRLEMSGRRL